METKSALLVGVGGQGAILAAKVFTQGLLRAGYEVKMSEVHGMAQRGGSVSTQVHWGTTVHAPVIGKHAADAILAFEKMEAVRYADYLKKDGIAVINDYEIPPTSVAAGLCPYPSHLLETLKLSRTCVILDAAQIAAELGNSKCMNLVLFGAMTEALSLNDIDWEEVIRSTVPPKFLELNLAAYRAGQNAVCPKERI